MLILAIDTSGKQGSITLARGDESSFSLIETTPVEGGTFSAQLVPQIAALLARHQLRKEQIDAFAAATGPGSFTGLRVGLAAIKALAEVLRKPIAAVSLLQAIAAAGLKAQGVWQADAKAKVAALLDAGRDEIYCGEYAFADPLPIRLQERLLRPEELAAQLQAPSVKIAALTPDGHLLEILRKTMPDPERLKALQVEHPGSAGIARLGIQKILAGEVTSVEELDANYIRRSDAEIFSLPKIQGAAK